MSNKKGSDINLLTFLGFLLKIILKITAFFLWVISGVISFISGAIKKRLEQYLNI